MTAKSAAVADSIDPLDRVIAKLYRSALAVTPEDFRAWALNQLARVIPHDGALWGSGSRAQLKFHTVTVTGLPPEFPQVLEASTAINPILPHIIRNLDTPVDMRQAMPDEAFFASDLYRRTFEPYGISRILSTGHLDRRSGLYSLLTLYRKDRERPFSDEEKALQKRAIYHLFNAASHAFFLHLALTRTERPPGSAAAVVDRAGRFHEAQPRFLDLLDERFPTRTPNELPFRLPEEPQAEPFQDLMLRWEPLGDLRLVIVWPAGPLDRLTAREREIVTCVAQGLSFKQAAKKIGVAPSTVANHLYRVYRKLGVYSRTELASLVHPGSAPP
ncbi:MAG TPA: LuxR C-terminal-related transcriptional regulator [Solimonas sp.]|nr:LuxR C-terminal-related transcriptional regulator [Solimonas sp.]